MKSSCVGGERCGGYPATGPARFGGVHWCFGAENKARPATRRYWRRLRIAVTCMKDSELHQHAHKMCRRVSRKFVSNLVDLTATWLILPVVICLSQRLSHACLSIAGNSEAANSSLQQPLFLGSTLYLDNCGNSRANTCIKTRRKDGRIY